MCAIFAILVNFDTPFYEYPPSRPTMHPGIFALLSTTRRTARHEPLSRCSFIRYAIGSRGFLRRRSGRSLLISCKQQKQRKPVPDGGVAGRFQPVLILQKQVGAAIREPRALRWRARPPVGFERELTIPGSPLRGRDGRRHWPAAAGNSGRGRSSRRRGRPRHSRFPRRGRRAPGL